VAAVPVVFNYMTNPMVVDVVPSPRNYIGMNGALSLIVISATTAPTTTGTVVEVLYNGTVIATIPFDTTVAGAVAAGGGLMVPFTLSVAQTVFFSNLDYFQTNITAVSTPPPAGLAVHLMVQGYIQQPAVVVS